MTLLPGQGHRVVHNLLQLILQSMMKLGGISLQAEAVNFLLGRVGEPHITQYVNHVMSHLSAKKAPYAFVPDILVHNFPTG